MVDVLVNSAKIIGENYLSLSVQTDWQNWISLVNIPVYGELLKEANVKLVRVFDFRPTTPKLMPCTYWDEATKTGTWDWTNVDAFTRKVFEIGAEPLFCLGYARSPMRIEELPSGMAINPETGLPYPDSYAVYAREWAKHFREIGLPVRFYEIMNEPFAYFGWTPDATKLRYFTDLYRASYQAMKAENPTLIIANDFNTRKQVLDYWLSQGVEMDSLNFHKYDGYGIVDPSDPNYRTDAQVFGLGETRHFSSDPLGRSVMDSRQIYYNTRGKILPIINSESNLNAHWETGTDIRNVNMCGAVWLALVLRMSMLNGLSYHTYFQMASSYNWEKTNKPLDGAGFGFINSDNKKPWAPYYVYRMIGPNLDVGDKIVRAETLDERLRAIVWVHRNHLNVLLINKSHDHVEVSLTGVLGTCSYLKIDEAMPFEDMYMEEGTANVDSITLSGYTVMLLQTQYIPQKYFFKQWQDGDINPTKTINV